MAAFNYIVLHALCPNCHQAASLEAQTHMASDYEGDETGRFMNERYPIGTRMKWFPSEHPDYDTWNTSGDGKNEATETCYARCPICQHMLAMVIHFRDVTPISVEEIALEDRGPRGGS